MINQQASKEFLFPRPFMLRQADKHAAFNKRAFWYLFAAAIMIVSGFILIYFSQIKTTHILYILALEILILFNVSFFFLRRQKYTGSFYLELDPDGIRLLRDDEIVYSEVWEQIKMGRLSWENDHDKNLPVIHLNGGSFPEILIAAALEDDNKTQSKKFLNSADMIITDEKEWHRLVQTLERLQCRSSDGLKMKSVI